MPKNIIVYFWNKIYKYRPALFCICVSKKSRAQTFFKGLNIKEKGERRQFSREKKKNKIKLVRLPSNPEILGLLGVQELECGEKRCRY